jgi:preprotein translocase subunit SecF
MINSILLCLRQKYEKNLNKLLIITFLILGLSVFSIAFQYFTTGDFIHRGVTLKGGVTVITPEISGVQTLDIENNLKQNFPGKDISVRLLKAQGQSKGYIIEAELQTKEEIDKLKSLLEKDFKLSENDLGIEVMGGTLGESFFQETFKSIIIAFLFMSLAVFIYFRSPGPSMIVIICAFADIVETLAVVNLIGIKLSTAGIAAFLMLIGYSVDSDMLLSTKMLKRTEGTIMDRAMGAFKTGIMMSVTTMAAIIAGLIFAKSDVLIQIMQILLIGMVFDILNTWIQNVALLKNYMEKRKKHHEHHE